MSAWRSGAETAVLVGRLAAASAAMHRSLGAASLSAGTASATVLLDELSLEHAWHAELLVGHLPRRAGVDRSSLIDLGPAEPAFAVIEELGRGGDAVGTAAAYAAGALPRIAEAAELLAASLSEAAERSLRRSLGFISMDLATAGRRGEEALASLLADAGAEAHAQRVAGDIAAALAEGCGPTGLGG